MSVKERKTELKARAKEFGIKLDGRMSIEEMEKEIDKANNAIPLTEDSLINALLNSDEMKPFVNSLKEPAQSRAIRIWEGQSTSLPYVDRIARIKDGLSKLYTEEEIAEVVMPPKDGSDYVEEVKKQQFPKLKIDTSGIV